MNEDEVAAIARSLVMYLRTYPLACDSAVGIATWWLGPRYDVQMNVVVRALDWLKEKALIEEISGADGRIRYRRCGSDALLDAALATPPFTGGGDDRR